MLRFGAVPAVRLGGGDLLTRWREGILNLIVVTQGSRSSFVKGQDAQESSSSPDGRPVKGLSVGHSSGETRSVKDGVAASSGGNQTSAHAIVAMLSP